MIETPKRHVPPSFGDLKQLPTKIQVRFVKFREPTDIPGEQVCERIKCDPATNNPNQKHWVVYYLTALDSFEIYFYPADQRQPVEVALLHVSNARQWWPVLG